MKKSKLLIPLAGLAGVATIAMPLVLTSCGQKVTMDCTNTSSGVWTAADTQDINTKNTYIYKLIGSKGIATTGFVTILAKDSSSDATYLKPSSFKINGVSAGAGIEVIGTGGWMYSPIRAVEGELEITVKFSNSGKDVQVGFVIV